MPETNLAQAQELFRELLKEVRVRSNLTQTEVARRLGLPQSYVSKYETGERRLDFVETLFVCEVLGVSFEHFVRQFSAKLATLKRRM